MYENQLKTKQIELYCIVFQKSSIGITWIQQDLYLRKIHRLWRYGDDGSLEVACEGSVWCSSGSHVCQTDTHVAPAHGLPTVTCLSVCFTLDFEVYSWFTGIPKKTKQSESLYDLDPF